MNPVERSRLMQMISPKLIDYLFSGSGIEVAKRKYDGNYNVWQKVIEFHDDDGTWSSHWQTVGVFSEEREALRFARTFTNTDPLHEFV